jgi:hypothetical protein
MENIDFIDCKVISCSFKDVDFSMNVNGLSEKDKNVILESDEQVDLIELKNLGFEQTEPYSYVIASDDGLAKLIVVKDEEYGPYTWRVMISANDESLLSDTIDIEEDISLSRISRIIKAMLYDSRKDLMIGRYDDIIPDDQKESIEMAFKNIRSKFKEYYSPDDI